MEEVIIIKKSGNEPGPLERPRGLVSVGGVRRPEMVRFVVFGESELELMKNLRQSAIAVRHKMFGDINGKRNSPESVS